MAQWGLNHFGRGLSCPCRCHAGAPNVVFRGGELSQVVPGVGRIVGGGSGARRGLHRGSETVGRTPARCGQHARAIDILGRYCNRDPKDRFILRHSWVILKAREPVI